MKLSENQKKQIKELAQDLFLEIIKHQPYTELEGDLNNLGKYCVNVAITYVTNDWKRAVDKIINNNFYE